MRKFVLTGVPGSMVRPQPLVANKTGRNDPCPYGSDRKYKKCYGK